MRALIGAVTAYPFEREDARAAGRLRASLARQGAPIGACDLLLAAAALRRGLTFVTHNMRAFERIGGLGLQDWRECQAGRIPELPHTTRVGAAHIDAGLNSLTG